MKNSVGRATTRRASSLCASTSIAKRSRSSAHSARDRTGSYNRKREVDVVKVVVVIVVVVVVVVVVLVLTDKQALNGKGGTRTHQHNFAHYGWPQRLLGLALADLAHSPWRTAPLFDAVAMRCFFFVLSLVSVS